MPVCLAVALAATTALPSAVPRGTARWNCCVDVAGTPQAMGRESAYGDRRGEEPRTRSKRPEEHVASIFIAVIPKMCKQDVAIDVIGIGDRGPIGAEYLQDNWKNWKGQVWLAILPQSSPQLEHFQTEIRRRNLLGLMHSEAYLPKTSQIHLMRTTMRQTFYSFL
ncbi:MAG: hypothetical protein Q9226_001364 [Calogaya cf. arnoldii]